jgi:D-glycero-alpha-D-manno-heptose 1-phosphate guanylyltransferase
MKTREAIILAGGLGSRLKEEVPDVPKCMAPVNGKPFLTYVLTYLEKQNFNKVILSVGHLKEQIINYFGNSFQSISIDYAIEHEPLGTGGAIKLALTQSCHNNVFVLNGDTFFTANLESMEQLHFNSGSDITLAVKLVENANRYGIVEMDSTDRIISFREKDQNAIEGWINGGIYLINKQVIEAINENKFSIENDFFKLFTSTLKFQAFRSLDFFLDMGIPHDYRNAQSSMLQFDAQ